MANVIVKERIPEGDVPFKTRAEMIKWHNAEVANGSKELGGDFGTKLELGKVYKGKVVGYKTLPFIDSETGKPFHMVLTCVQVEGLERPETIATTAKKAPKQGDAVTIEAKFGTGARANQLFAQFATVKAAAAPTMKTAKAEEEEIPA